MHGDMPKELPRTLLGETGDVATSLHQTKFLRKAGPESLEDVPQQTMPMSGVVQSQIIYFFQTTCFHVFTKIQ